MSIDTGLGLTYKENYPVPGINQSSQQFRDNFTVIREALENLHAAKTADDSLFAIRFSLSEDDGTVTVGLDYPTPLGGTPATPGTMRFSNDALQYWNTDGWHTLVSGTGNGAIAAEAAAVADTVVLRDRSGAIAVNAVTAASRVEAHALASVGPILSQRLRANVAYPEGTVVVYGGEADITVTTSPNDTRVAGVVADPSMGGARLGTVGPDDALDCHVVKLGTALCRVTGPVTKGALLTTANVTGTAMVATSPMLGAIIGKAMEDKLTDGVETILIAVGLS